MLDRLPAWARHLVIIYGATFGLFVVQAVIAAGGVWPFPWIATLQGAVNAGAVSAAAVAVLWLSSLTRQYGAGATKDKQ